ncbi:MAG TPA: SH3 domain-containing protein [Hyphomicrobiales bacterium]|nr:SH3 domain-containing protein [Hyphomicrobiales bacterium]
MAKVSGGVRLLALGSAVLGAGAVGALLLWGVVPSAATALAGAARQPKGVMAFGSVSGLPIPRFVSLKSDEVNVRRGPGNDHQVEWIYRRAGLPVEITAEWDNWREIRDADGTVGWVWHSLLSGRRTVLVAPWNKGDGTLPLLTEPAAGEPVVARLEPKVMASVSKCTGQWCRIWGKGFDGWVQQDRLWGVYPDEKVD